MTIFAQRVPPVRRQLFKCTRVCNSKQTDRRVTVQFYIRHLVRIIPVFFDVGCRYSRLVPLRRSRAALYDTSARFFGTRLPQGKACEVGIQFPYASAAIWPVRQSMDDVLPLPSLTTF